MRKIYCDFCKEEITAIYHEVRVDNIKYEVCEKCNIKFIEKLTELTNDKSYAKLENKI